MDIMIEIADLAREIEKMENEEMHALACFLQKAGETKVAIPAAAQWSYEYHKKEYIETKWGTKTKDKTGVASARFFSMACSGASLLGHGSRLILKSGPTSTFINMPIEYRDLREKLGGFAPLLAAIKESLIKAKATYQIGRDVAMEELNGLSKNG